ncbi:hypothetical protein Ancab_016435 [Ancistrocladus abbreviatus]
MKNSIPEVLAFNFILGVAYLFSNTMAESNNTGSLQLVHNATRVSTRGSRYNNFCFPFCPFYCPPPTPLAMPPPAVQPPPPPPTSPPVAPAPISPPSSIIGLLTFVDQRLAVVYPIIQKFKNSITSDPLNITGTWVGSDICSYEGFYCGNPPDNLSATVLASIDFNGYHLTAPTINGFLDQLPDLALFHANSNNFAGTISANISKLRYLYELDISNNKFSGPFPAAVVGMDNLIFLDIRFNMFSGSVPPAIFTQDLLVLFLNDNKFISFLPANLRMSQILYLTLADNKFIGPIPGNLFKALSALTEVLLLNNQLTGCLPYQLGFLKNATVLDVSSNLLTGPLPFSLSCLENIAVLNFGQNFLYGMVPDLICLLPNLVNFTLSDNYFTHVGPACRSLIRSGVLDVTNNCIPGLPFQRSVIECTAFFAIPRICPYWGTFKIIPCIPPYFH